LSRRAGRPKSTFNCAPRTSLSRPTGGERSSSGTCSYDSSSRTRSARSTTAPATDSTPETSVSTTTISFKSRSAETRIRHSRPAPTSASLRQLAADLRRVSAPKLAEENNRLRAENLVYKRQAATWQNDSLVARSAETILSAKLYNAQVRLTDVRRALGEACEYPQRTSKGIPLSYHWPHSPLDTNQLAHRRYENLRFALGNEIYLAAAPVAVPTALQHE
jgi:hypothetical protein